VFLLSNLDAILTYNSFLSAVLLFWAAWLTCSRFLRFIIFRLFYIFRKAFTLSHRLGFCHNLLFFLTCSLCRCNSFYDAFTLYFGVCHVRLLCHNSVHFMFLVLFRSKLLPLRPHSHPFVLVVSHVLHLPNRSQSLLLFFTKINLAFRQCLAFNFLDCATLSPSFQLRLRLFATLGDLLFICTGTRDNGKLLFDPLVNRIYTYLRYLLRFLPFEWCSRR